MPAPRQKVLAATLPGSWWTSDKQRYPSMQWLSDSVTLWLSNPVTQWLSDSVTQWLSNPVTQWLLQSLERFRLAVVAVVSVVAKVSMPSSKVKYDQQIWSKICVLV